MPAGDGPPAQTHLMPRPAGHAPRLLIEQRDHPAILICDQRHTYTFTPGMMLTGLHSTFRPLTVGLAGSWWLPRGREVSNG